jgi:hypothetical protein
MTDRRIDAFFYAKQHLGFSAQSPLAVNHPPEE